jgi:raffinose/stachyose/melibiose transport system permease protein
MFSRLEKLGAASVLMVAMVVTLYPILVVLAVAFEPTSKAADGISFVHGLSLSSFTYAWSQGGFAHYTLSTVIVTGAVVLLTLVLATIGAYSVALLRPAGSRVLFYVAVIGFMLPTEVLITPWFYEMRSLGWVDSYLSLIVPSAAQSVAFGIFWMNTAFLAVPRSLTEAAVLDGASRFNLFRLVLLPSVGPALKTMAALVFLWTWNAFLLPLVMVSNPARFMVTVGLANFEGSHFNNYGALAAGSVLAALPVVLVYLFAQRSFITGMFAGSSVG